MDPQPDGVDNVALAHSGRSEHSVTEAEDVLYVVEDHVAWITFNRPTSLNSFSPELLTGTYRSLHRAADDPQVRVVVVTGAGRAFSAGGNVKSMNHHVVEGTRYPTQNHREVMRITAAIDDLDKPLIASLNGVAAGAGFELALQADLRIAADTAYLKPAALRLGLVPGDGSVYFLPRLVGAGKACEILFFEQEIHADEALRLGLFNRVVPAADLAGATRQMAAELAAKPPLALAATKRAMKMGATCNVAAVMEFLHVAVAANRTTEDHAEGLAAFRERRAPEFQGR
jgi:enoyl-CoA hydratase/carnithine racemase